MFECFDNYVAEITPQSATNEFLGLVLEAGRNPLIQILNVALIKLTTQALKDGWKPGEMKLGRFVQMNIKDRVFSGDDSSVYEYKFKNLEAVLTLMDEFGDLFIRDGEWPLLTLRDKETRELFQIDEDQLHDYISLDELREFVAWVAE